jgi:hypothetical protein
MLASLGKQHVEDSAILGEGGAYMTKEAAQAKIKELQSHEAYLKVTHPEYKQIHQEVSQLYQYAYGDQPVKKGGATSFTGTV